LSWVNPFKVAGWVGIFLNFNHALNLKSIICESPSAKISVSPK